MTPAHRGRRYETVTLLTDYGTSDEFVGVLHSVIRQIAPHVAIVDLSHDVDPHDVRGGGLMLARSAQYLAPGVVVAVVDPGVGTDRREIAVEVGDGASVLIGPDNGLLAPAVGICGGATRAVQLTSTEHRFEAPGATFAGRDVFAPAAAHIANGVDLTELGPVVDAELLLPGLVPLTRLEEGRIYGEILWVDRFGNCQLNVDPDELEALDPDAERVLVHAGMDGAPRAAIRAKNYAALAPGQLGLVVDSYGLLSLSLDRASAAEDLRVGAGAPVVLEIPT